ncbi:rho GTPase-activating protein 11A isoform X1 [Micropterus salmoides]|uniref:rho GTPase-activating protein 11A isoform X1 n=1 Tax=Micropterus salmoides TaxID=27706 RepID=UPI0018ED3D31|nr:rho GTPase-activating protein 11A isoform X1 [Micropterus salmoides]
MKVMEKNVMRLVAVQHLRSAYGIKTKNWNKSKAASCNVKATASGSTKVFGVSLENLPYYNMECGRVPSFLVDACQKLMAHVDTEGLFRKSGSVVRLKALRAKLDVGEECLFTALPCDVAGLVKQFFRELPEPVLPTELQEAFLKAQQLPTMEDRTSATMLLSCVLPDRNQTVLRHFFDFLHNVSKRSAENKMDSSNLSVILAPNLLHFGDGTEKMNANTEKRLKLQAAIIHCFIENAHNFGVLPQFLLEKVPAMIGCEAGGLSPSHHELEELDSGMKKRHRRSFGDMVNGALSKIKTNRTPTNATQSDSLVFSSATPVIATPSSKRKLPLESGHSFGFSNKKRRSIKKNLGIELLPSTLFSGTSTPGSANSASGVLDSSQNTQSSAGRSRRHSTTSMRRKSRRLSNRHAVNRVESGSAGCFSPKASKKEAPHKYLRLRFSMGKSSKDAGSESIGWRLATQESTTRFCFTEETEFTPSAVPRKAESKSSKYISKSEDNLLTPQYDSSVHQISWSGETPVGAQAFSRGSFTDTPMNMCLKTNYMSEPAIVISKPPAVASLPKKLCCASSAESLESECSILKAPNRAGPTLLKIKTAFAESDSDLQAVIQDPCNSTGTCATNPSDNILVLPPQTPTGRVLSVDTEASSFPAPESLLANDHNITFGHSEIDTLSPLHIDSVVSESDVYCSPALKVDKDSFCDAPISSHNSFVVVESEREEEQVNCSRLIDALDIHSPAPFKLGVSPGLQSTPYKLDFELRGELGTPPGTIVSAVQEKNRCSEVEKQQPLSPRSLETEKRRVADHIHHFNKLTLRSPRGSMAKQTRSPLKFQRTPVRQTIRRMNTLLGESRRPTRHAELSQGGPLGKAVSLESGLSPHSQLQPYQGEAQMGLSNSICPIKKAPPVPPKRPSTLARKPKACALDDMTNKVQPKTKVDCSVPDPSGAQKPLVQQVVGKDMNHYRGSPRNPLNQGRLMSATRPVDL